MYNEGAAINLESVVNFRKAVRSNSEEPPSPGRGQGDRALFFDLRSKAVRYIAPWRRGGPKAGDRRDNGW